MTIKMNHGYDSKKGLTVESVVEALVKAHAKNVVSGVTNLTNSSGGTPATGIVDLSVALVNVAASGSNLADTTTTAAALVTVQDALKEIGTKANEYATLLGITNLTYSGGGAAADGTVGAVTQTVTAAATGAQASNLNADTASINAATYKLAAFVNQLLRATGYTELTLTTGHTVGTVGAITTATGTAASPGVTAVAVNAELVKAANNVATLATQLNKLNDGLGTAVAVVL
jgi:hypothetical protein